MTVELTRNSSCGKTVRIVTALARSESPCLVQDIADAARLRLATTYRLLQDLVAGGWASYDRTTRLYRIGTEFLRLATLVTRGRTFGELLPPLLRELVDACNETVAFYLYDPAHQMVTPVLAEHGAEALGYAVDLGQLKHLHAGASGKATMAFLDQPALEAVLARYGLPAMTPNTVTDRGRLDADLARIRRDGYAISQGERVAGAVGIGAPVFRPNGEIAGTLLITIPSFRFDPSSEPRMASLVMRYASRLTLYLGSAAPPALENFMAAAS